MIRKFSVVIAATTLALSLTASASMLERLAARPSGRTTQSLTAGQISEIQTHRLTLYVYPDWPTRRVLVGGPLQYQAYQQYRLSQHLPAENPPQVYRGPSTFDWRQWYHEGGEPQG